MGGWGGGRYLEGGGGFYVYGNVMESAGPLSGQWKWQMSALTTHTYHLSKYLLPKIRSSRCIGKWWVLYEEHMGLEEVGVYLGAKFMPNGIWSADTWRGMANCRRCGALTGLGPAVVTFDLLQRYGAWSWKSYFILLLRLGGWIMRSLWWGVGGWYIFFPFFCSVWFSSFLLFDFFQANFPDSLHQSGLINYSGNKGKKKLRLRHMIK